LRKLGIATIVLFLWAQMACSFAATIKIIRDFSNERLIVVALEGEILKGDAAEFLNVIANNQNVVVFLNSNGGDAVEGLAIAKTIRKLGFTTAVVVNSKCMSACALIWVAGNTRFLSDNSLVGFHSVYTSDGVSSDGNAIYGAFYGQLGLSDKAITYLTAAPPEGYNQVTLAIAPLLDIPVVSWDKMLKDLNKKEKKSPEVSQYDTDFSSAAGVDIIGFDLHGGSFKTENPNSCLAACSANSICAAYTFDFKNHVCYQKVGGRLLLRNPEAYSGARSKLSANFKDSALVIYGHKNSPGFDYKSINKISFEECVFACDAEITCSAFSYARRSKICFMKTGHDVFSDSKNIVSGIK
jgi:Clp protease/PAN domain